MLKRKIKVKTAIKVFLTALLIFISNFYLQLCQNDFSWSLARKFTFSWHTQKFLLACFVLLCVYLLLISILGSWWKTSIVYTGSMILLGFANYQKMKYRLEPLYPDDLKMIKELSLLKEMIGWTAFLSCAVIVSLIIVLCVQAIYKSFYLPFQIQMIRGIVLIVSFCTLLYIHDFNNPDNLLRKEYDKTAVWIPYSQKMNYYNVGFIGGFLYNLKVEAMAQPENYSQEAIEEIVKRYPSKNIKAQEKPHIIFIMSESFSDPLKVKGMEMSGDPIEAFRKIADQTVSGQMLSQNYGGGTANIEFEALTGFSMEPLNSQMTTPYTMLLPKVTSFPSIAHSLKEIGYETTAIHPYNTTMYKRKDVYPRLGFDTFIDESMMTFTNKIENNPYISDESAFKEVKSRLKNTEPQFIHLVTMQTHMPYADKYKGIQYKVKGSGDDVNQMNYMQDIAYTSEALEQFLQQLDQLERRTLVVFWGDHLPSNYSETIKKSNPEVAMHQTEYLFYDTAHKLKRSNQISSPFYFASQLFNQSQLPQSGFQQLLLQLREEIPAFEKNMYYYNHKWEEDNPIKDKQIYRDYQMIQYDIVSGKKFSQKLDFYQLK